MTDSAGYILGAMITPAMAYAGLGAAALPILIHLFNRRRYRRIRWAATKFLLEAERRNRRRTRLEEWILLALRCLAMMLFGVALARWFVQPQSLVASLGSAARTDHIIVVDDSFSMSATGGESAAVAPTASTAGAVADLTEGTEPRVFDSARRAVQQLIDHIRQVAPEDSVTLLVTSRPDRPVRTALSLSQAAPAALTEDIGAMQPSSRAGNMPAAMKAVRDLLDSRQGTVRAAVYVISDFQRIDWAPGGAGAGGPSTAGPAAAQAGDTASGPMAVLAGWGDGKRAIEIVLIDVGHNIASNRSVAAIQPEQAQAISGVVGRYKVRIENYGSESAKPGEMQVFMGDTALPPVPVPAIDPNQGVDVPVELAFGQEGSQRLTVQFASDALASDNARSCAVPVERALRVLMVNGEASPDPYQDEAFLLNVALRPEGPEFSGNETAIINEDEFEVADLSEYHAVFLLNVNRVTQEMAHRLEQFADGGGGVVFFLGDQVDTAAYNRLLHRDGAGILPAKLGDAVTVPAEQAGARLAQTEEDARSAVRFGSQAALLLGDALVWQYIGTQISTEPTTESPTGPTDTGPGAPAATAPADGSAVPSRGLPRCLLQLDDADRTPLLVERSFGRGRVLMFTTAADKEWNNLPDQPVYVVLMMELTQYVARPAQGGGDQFVGEPIRLAIDQAVYEPTVMLKLPTYPATPAVRLEARLDSETGQAIIEWTDTARPGLYQFDLRKTRGETVTRQIAVNLEPRESDVRRVERSELLASLGSLPASYVTGDSLADRARGQARQELWPVVLGLLIAVLMLEQALAWWFGADRSLQRGLRWTAA
jgi:hypothetical protein